MNIKQRRRLSEMTGSSSLSPFVLLYLLSPFHYYFYPLQTPLFVFFSPLYLFKKIIQCKTMLVSEAKSTRPKSIQIAPVSFDMLITLYKSILFEDFSFWIRFFSRLMFSESIVNFLVHHQNKAPCNVCTGPRRRGYNGRQKVFQRFKYLIVNDKHHFTTI